MKSGGQWLRSPIWDSTWLLCGIWLLGLGLAIKGTPAFDNAYIGFVFVFWVGHRFSTVYLAFSSPSYGSLLALQRVRFLIAPVAIAALVFGFLFAPASVLPLSLGARVVLLMMLDYFFNLHHFAVQHYGVLSIYRLRAGQDPTSRIKVFEKIYCLWVGGALVLLGEIFQGAFLFESILLKPLVSHETLVGMHGVAQGLATLIIVAFTAGLLIAEWKSGRPSLPKSLYLLSVGALCVSAYFLSFDDFVALWTIQHWIVSVGLAGHMVESDARKTPPTSGWYRLWSWPNRYFWSAVVLLAIVSVLGMPFLEVEAGAASEQYGPLVFPRLSALLNTQPWLQICIALGFVTGFVHYLIDRAVFRFSNEETRACSLPLLMARPRDDWPGVAGDSISR